MGFFAGDPGGPAAGGSAGVIECRAEDWPLGRICPVHRPSRADPPRFPTSSPPTSPSLPSPNRGIVRCCSIAWTLAARHRSNGPHQRRTTAPTTHCSVNGEETTTEVAGDQSGTTRDLCEKTGSAGVDGGGCAPRSTLITQATAGRTSVPQHHATLRRAPGCEHCFRFAARRIRARSTPRGSQDLHRHLRSRTAPQTNK